MNKSNVQHGDYGGQYCVGYLKFAKRVEIRCSHHKHTNTRLLATKVYSDPSRFTEEGTSLAMWVASALKPPHSWM